MFLLPSLFVLADEFEIGISLTPMDVLKTEEDKIMQEAQSTGGGLLSDFVLGLHAGYSLAWLFYASVDANAMPPWWVAKQTATVDETTGDRIPGDPLPAFVSFFDVGIRPTFGSFIVMAEIGINHFYIYQGQGESGNKLGVNARIGLGYSLSSFSINLCGTMIFADFDTMKYVFKALADEEEWAKDALGKSLIPSIAVYMHL